MTLSAQHQHVTLTPRPDKLAETRDIIARTVAQVAAAGPGNGPTSYCITAAEDGQQFFVEALFDSQEAVAFHEANVAELVEEFGAVMAAPPEWTIRSVIAVAKSAPQSLAGCT